MKSMKVGKLAALGVAAAAVAAPFAAAMVHTDALPTDRTWYLDSHIVVGYNAIGSDVVAAANIAAAIAQLAYKQAAEISGSSTGGEVQLAVPGQIVVGGQGYTDSESVDLTSGTIDFNGTYTNVKVPTLADNKDISFKYYDSAAQEWKDADGKYSEKLIVGLDAVEAQVSNTDKAAVRLKTYTGDMAYEYVISGILGDELKSNKGYELKNFYVDLLGVKYEVTDINFAASPATMSLVSYQETKVVPVGSEVDFEGYKIKVADIDPDNQTAYLQLIDSQGNVVATDVVKAGGYTDFDGALEDSIKVDTVFAGTTEKFAKLELKADKMVLNKGEAKELDNYKGWYIEWNTDDQNDIVFKVYYAGNDNDDYLTFDTGIGVGETFKYMGTVGYGVTFLGFESKPTKTVTFDGKYIDFIDKDGATHQSLLYKEITDAAIANSNNTASATVYGLLDGKDAKVVVATQTENNSDTAAKYAYADVTVKFDLGNDGSYEYAGESGWFLVDANTTTNPGTIDKVIAVTDPQTGIKYNVYVELDVSGVSPDNNAANDVVSVKDIRVSFKSNGVAPTGVSEDTPYAIDADVNNVSGMPIDWKITEIDGKQIVVPYDQKDAELDFKDYQIDAAGQKLDYESDNSYPENWWLDDGTYVEIEGSDMAKITVPIDPEKAQIFVGIPQSVSMGSNVITAKAGQTVKIGDYDVNVVKIACGATVPSGTYYEKVGNLNPIGFVVDDKSVPSGNLIVVGGWNANAVAAELVKQYPDIKTELENDKVIVNKYSLNGSDVILVAGWTAADTRKAAQEFIQFLEQNVQ